MTDLMAILSSCVDDLGNREEQRQFYIKIYKTQSYLYV